ncbi:GspH/FimT family pseudopilin [Rhizobacter sp. OV335]|uniref:GspH/FimT family pseudopilin n=1 Tax=Rhizobacter sp. OV335 TaxID=1500264 RepID=UPI00090F59A7|nr:GspH/FimT family pseudopilin [Rhizobacter sp. OV335]SHN39222.1 type IV fimbrial biogenesis protein FimT [Rhizobacter sp. OV335]
MATTHSNTNYSMRHSRRPLGVTLIELMVTLAVMAVLVTIAAPSFSRLIASNRLTSQTNEFILALNLARSEATRRGQPVTLLTKATASPVFQSGWQIFTDADGDATMGSTAADGSVLRESAAAPGNTTITRVTMSGSTATTATASAVPDRMYVTFNALGGKYSGAQAYFKVCDSSIPSLPGRVIQVSLVGRASLYLNNISCP